MAMSLSASRSSATTVVPIIRCSFTTLRCHGHFSQSDCPAGFACFDDHCMVTTDNNGIREGPEECDGSDFEDATCESMGDHFGVVRSRAS